jgi:hypothetical protein
MSTPEQRLHNRLKRELIKVLPKGKFMLQRIETSTGSGVPDCYFSFAGRSCWLETKTQVYKISFEQLNWNQVHKLTGGKAWVVTEVDKEIRFLEFDDRMSDCSNLGVYLRRYKPFMLNLIQWLAVNQPNQDRGQLVQMF